MKKILLLFFLLPIVFARSYHLTDSVVNVTVLDNGLVNVFEDLTYNFDGCYSVVYAEIPIGVSQVIASKGYSIETFVPYTAVENGNFVYEFRFNNPQCDKLVRTVLEYNMTNVVDSYDDVSGLHFMFWGNDAHYTESLTANIKLPNPVIDYWIHNSDKSYSTKNINVITFSKKNVNNGDWIETQVIFERINNNVYSKLVAGKGLENLTNTENKYSLSAIVQSVGILIIYILPLLLFGIVYYKFGIKRKPDYYNSTESDVPYDLPPAVVKAILSSADTDAFVATIFDLASKKYLEIIGDEKNVKIRILSKEGNLLNYENVVMLFLKKYADNGVVEWNILNNKLKAMNNSEDFEKRLKSFQKEVNNSFDRKDYFDNSAIKFYIPGVILCFFINLLILFVIRYLQGGLLFGLIIGMFTGIFSSFNLIFVYVIMGIIVGYIFRWSLNGKLFELKWKAFKKYLNDYSLLSQHPPQSIIIWERFLVYAIILGVADNVIKSMKLLAPQLSPSGVSRIHTNYFLYSSLRMSLRNSISAVTASRMRRGGGGHGGFGGGHGGFGGGHGGGGRGAR